MSRVLYTTSAAIRASGAEAGSVSEARKPRFHLRAGDIPQSVWDAASVGIDRVSRRQELIARAVMAETERIADMADEFGKAAGEPALITFADIIRKRGGE